MSSQGMCRQGCVYGEMSGREQCVCEGAQGSSRNVRHAGNRDRQPTVPVCAKAEGREGAAFLGAWPQEMLGEDTQKDRFPNTFPP